MELSEVSTEGFDDSQSIEADPPISMEEDLARLDSSEKIDVSDFSSDNSAEFEAEAETEHPKLEYDETIEYVSAGDLEESDDTELTDDVGKLVDAESEISGDVVLEENGEAIEQQSQGAEQNDGESFIEEDSNNECAAEGVAAEEPVVVEDVLLDSEIMDEAQENNAETAANEVETMTAVEENAASPVLDNTDAADSSETEQEEHISDTSDTSADVDMENNDVPKSDDDEETNTLDNVHSDSDNIESLETESYDAQESEHPQEEYAGVGNIGGNESDVRNEYEDYLSKDLRKQVNEMYENGEMEPTTEESTKPPSEVRDHLPTETSGYFEGERGNSAFYPKAEEAKESMQEFGTDHVDYVNNAPDFSPFSKHDSEWGKVDSIVEIGHMTDNRENGSWEYGRRPVGTKHDIHYDIGNFAQADNALRDKLNSGKDVPIVTSEAIETWRKDNHLIWHEMDDGKTMVLVPEAIHEACPHSGGVAHMKVAMAYGNYMPKE